MKRNLLVFISLLLLSSLMSACGPECKKCSAEVLGLKGPERELCGEELKKAEQTPGVTCQ
jgi:hypothetical protein